jgi:hypothetical protein
MEREKLILTSEELCDLVRANFYKDDTFTEIETTHDGGGRHEEYFDIVLQRDKDEKYFRASYSTSVKDTMGWFECNSSDKNEVVEVFPETVEITRFK